MVGYNFWRGRLFTALSLQLFQRKLEDGNQDGKSVVVVKEAQGTPFDGELVYKSATPEARDNQERVFVEATLSSSERDIETHISSLLKWGSSQPFSLFLFSLSSDETCFTLAERFSFDKVRVRITFFGITDFSGLVTKYGIETYSILKKFDTKNEMALSKEEGGTIRYSIPEIAQYGALGEILRQNARITQEQFNQHQAYLIRNVKKSLLANQTALLLGNGISLDYGADTWPKLVQDLLSYLQPMLVDDVSTSAVLVGGNSYSETQLVKFAFRNKIYNGLDHYYKAIHNCIYQKFLNLFPTETTLHSVGILLDRYSPETITFNYDEFLESDFRNYYPSKTICSLFDGALPVPTNAVVVNHVHGFMPVDYRQVTPSEQASIVLSEEEYFDFYVKKKKIWGYRMISDAVQNKQCVLIGLSLSDMYLRMIFKRATYWNGHVMILCRQGLDAKDRLVVRDYFLEMNVDIIWADTFKDIPNLILSFR